MKYRLLALLICVLAASSYAQVIPLNISPAQLQTVLDLPLEQAVKLRATEKVPLRAAYARQVALAGKDCHAEMEQGQQPYNICMGKAGAQAEQDFAIFYNHLQMLCHDQDELTAMHALEETWAIYKDGAMKATHASWPDGTGASGFLSQVYLSLIRGHMRQLDEIYTMNVSQ